MWIKSDQKGGWKKKAHTHTHTHTYIYIYIQIAILGRWMNRDKERNTHLRMSRRTKQQYLGLNRVGWKERERERERERVRQMASTLVVELSGWIIALQNLDDLFYHRWTFHNRFSWFKKSTPFFSHWPSPSSTGSKRDSELSRILKKWFVLGIVCVRSRFVKN